MSKKKSDPPATAKPERVAKNGAAKKLTTKKTTAKKAVAMKNKTVIVQAGATGDRRMLPPKSGVAVRMYRTGLGDCFLLCFPKRKVGRGAAEPLYILIDCGVFKGTE